MVDGQEASARWVIGFCAQWCGVCREWRSAFDAVQVAHAQDSFAWIDVEDEAGLMGDIDVETFPTLLVGRVGKVLFFGAVLPGAERLERLLTGLDPAGADAGTRGTRALLQRIAARKL